MDDKIDSTAENQESGLPENKPESLIGRRDALALSARYALAIAVLAAFGPLMSEEANAKGAKGKKKKARRVDDEDEEPGSMPEYTPDKFADQIWEELDPKDHDSPYFEIMEANYLSDRYPLLYNHNVKGKIEKKGVNIPTPSLVFELAKFCSRGARDKMAEVKERALVIPNIKEVASPDHPDYTRVMQIYTAVSTIDANNRQTWPPLIRITGEVVKMVQRMVDMEQKASKSLKCASDADEDIDNVGSIIPVNTETPKEEQEDAKLDEFEEVLSWTRTFTYECISGASYNDAPRPQTNSKLLEGAFMLRNVINVLYRIAYERHKALVEVKSRAVYLDSKSPAKKQLNKIAQLKTSQAIRDGWADLIRTQDTPYGRKGPVIQLIETMVQAYNYETQMAKGIRRCKPQGEEGSEYEEDGAYLRRAKKQLDPVTKDTESSPGEEQVEPENPLKKGRIY